MGPFVEGAMVHGVRTRVSGLSAFRITGPYWGTTGSTLVQPANPLKPLAGNTVDGKNPA